MSKVEDLQLRNYSLIFDSPFLMDALNSTISSHFLESSKFHQKDISTLKGLLQNVKVLRDEQKFLKTLAFGSYKVATVVRWPFALYTAVKANDILYQNMPFKRRQCFVGNELVHSGPYYYGFLPPGDHLRLRDIFMALLEAGIVDLWRKEFFGLAYSPGRVQDKLRVKSPINILTDDHEQLLALKVQGKIITVFLIWMLCLVLAALSFSLEKLSLTSIFIKIDKSIFK